MDPTLLSLLETIPQKPPRSKLETHSELIRQLRRRMADPGCGGVRHDVFIQGWDGTRLVTPRLPVSAGRG